MTAPLDLDALRRLADEWSVDLQARLMAAAKDSDDDGASNLMGEAACALKMGSIEAATLRARNADLEWLADDLADKVAGLEAQLACVAEGEKKI
jgi:hypothetical protein